MTSGEVPISKLKKFPCPCCRYLTLEQEPPGTFAICDICFWEDDYVQFHHPDSDVGANKVSLNQARQNFEEFGACTEKMLEYTRDPAEDEERVGNSEA